MKIDLSVICPGIRTSNWERLYKSIQESFHGTFEIIFVGPYPVPDALLNRPNIQYIQDWGTPIRCQQIGLLAARGEWISWAADDGRYLPHALDIAFEKLASEHMKKDVVIMGKYYEGNNDGDMPMQGDDYYYLAKHDGSRSTFLPDNYLMLNVGVLARQLLIHFGGWDCQFEVCPMAYNDLAIRLQNHGVKFIIQQEMMFTCSHMPGHAGDHGPVHDAQVYFDEPKFWKIYHTPGCEKRGTIDLLNYQQCAPRWERRFGKAA